MRHILSAALLITFILAAHSARACSCLWQGPFTAVQLKANVVLAGEIVQTRGNSMDLAVQEVLRGREFRERVRIWGKKGELCRAEVSDFPVGTRWVMALDRIDSVPENGFDPATPNISYGRRDDYSLSRCGVYWLRWKGDLVSGNIAAAGRWHYRDPDKRPVLFSLLRKHLRGELPAEALARAEEPQRDTDELMDKTQRFLWKQSYE